MDLIVTIYHAGTLTVLGLILLTLLANMIFIPVLREQVISGNQPLVSVLVPARNEAHRIAPCLRSLLAQNYSNLEIVVLDDQSEDGTADLVKSFQMGLSPDRLRLIEGEALPRGWTGKAWACQQLARVARGELLLFTDADTAHPPGTIAAAVLQQGKTQADLLTIWPYQITETLAEKLVIPLMFIAASGYLPLWFLVCCRRLPPIARVVPRLWMRNLGAASGQFLLFRRESYERIGGHERVYDSLVEDVALARTVASETANGMRLVNCDGTHLTQCRMYESLEEMWEGFTKNIRPLFGQGNVGFLAAMVGQFLVLVLPFVIVFLAPGPLTLAELLLIYSIRISAALRYRTSWLSVALHPVGYSLALAIALNSFRQTAGRGVRWKGRTYQGARSGQEKG
jgi:chlorobactene glucosyltransferase